MSQKIAIALICLCASTPCLGMSRVSQQGTGYVNKYVHGLFNRFYPRTKGSSPKPLSLEQGIAKLESKDNMLKDRWFGLDREYANQERILANAENRYEKTSMLDYIFPPLQKYRRAIAMRRMQDAKNTMKLIQEQGQVVKNQTLDLEKQVSFAAGTEKGVPINRGISNLKNSDKEFKSQLNELDREYAKQDRILANAEKRYEKTSMFDYIFPSRQKHRRDLAMKEIQNTKNTMNYLQDRSEQIKDHSLTLKRLIDLGQKIDLRQK